jgi:hypothetical protein
LVSDAAAYLIFDDTVINKKYGDNVELNTPMMKPKN